MVRSLPQLTSLKNKKKKKKGRLSHIFLVFYVCCSFSALCGHPRTILLKETKGGLRVEGDIYVDVYVQCFFEMLLYSDAQRQQCVQNGLYSPLFEQV